MADDRHFHAAICEPSDREVTRDSVAALVLRILNDQGIDLVRDATRPGYLRCDQFDLSIGRVPVPARTPNRIVLELRSRNGSSDLYLSPDLVLIIVMYRLTQVLRPKCVEWLDDQAVIPAAAFLAAFDGVETEESAHAARARRKSEKVIPVAPATPEPESAEVSDDQRIAAQLRVDSFAIPPTRAEQARNDLRRLTAWAMTGCVATLSLPVAASLVAVNVIRGEDFRLNTQVLSLTGLVGTISGFGL